MKQFQLDANFVQMYSRMITHFGFDGLGEIVYRRSYSRLKSDGATHEEWFETVERVVNGTFNMQRRHCLEKSIPFDYQEAQELAQKMYDKIFHLKFCPPGRGLWAMGTSLTEERNCYTSLNNCAFVSTEYVSGTLFSKPFVFLLDLTMLGVGVGFDTKGAGQIVIQKPTAPCSIVQISDNRKGWVDSLQVLLESYFQGTAETIFDYSLIRPEGTLVKGFGGRSSGSAPLKTMHDTICQILNSNIGQPISSRIIVDLMNVIGRAIIGIRPSAEIAFGECNDEVFVQLKNYELFPERKAYGWASNNTIFVQQGMDYSKYVPNIVKNGEPGFCWLDSMKKYGRMCDPPNFKDSNAKGGPPCLEQTLESYEMCCLVETFPNNHKSYEEFEDTLKYAHLYAKTVTLGLSHWKETSEVISKNRRIGCSMSGIVQFLETRSMSTLVEWCKAGYSFLQKCDAEVSHKYDINKSIKMTCVKPSGTVSLLAGATAGAHFPESLYYIRRVRFQACSELYEPLRKSGYKIEYDNYTKDQLTLVVEIPVFVGSKCKTVKEVSMWEQAELAATLQKYWADNQVSCSIKFDPENEAKDLPKLLNEYQYKLKAICFLPKQNTQYDQMPYEEISESKYLELKKNIQGNISRIGCFKDPVAEKFCDNDKCVSESYMS